MQPSRHIDIKGADNVRDLGGYPTLDGRQTRWRTFLRSDGMGRLTPRSQERLVQYGVRTVIDLRRTWEVRSAPNVFADSIRLRYHHQNMLGDDPFVQTEVDAEATGRLGALYGLWLDRVQGQVGKTLATLVSPSGPPAVFHCSAGKDRTGIISALLLSLAGVPSDTIASDYALTAPHLFDADVSEPTRTDLPAIYSVEDY